MPDPLGWLDDELAALDAAGLRRRLAMRDSPQRERVRLGGPSLINFGSNDYLGLADEALLSSVRDVLERTGWGAGASPLVTGRAAGHARLEQRLAVLEGRPAALLFSSGYAANVGVITSLVAGPDVIFSDAKNHASIIDGCRLSGARIEIYPHRDVRRLAEQLAQAASFRRRLIVTDGLFSMDGDLAPLAALADLAERYSAMLMVDEAHATGVFGRRGRGVAEFLGAEDGVHVTVGTLSKALGSMGGFAAGSRPLIDWLSNRARSYVYSTAAPEALAEAGCRAVDLVEREPRRREVLLERAAELRERLRRQDWNLGDSASQIIPLILGDAQAVIRAAAQLREEGFFVPGIRPPSVPEGQSLLRISLTCSHAPEDVDRLVRALAGLRSKRGSDKR
jgi:8-amino-7-oxononanoate synthase